uniref:Signal recognition particle receptor subunit beta n=1 Tax=Trichuris muris TaxID=70415 RepID=A0A5S6QZ81_TRIMR
MDTGDFLPFAIAVLIILLTTALLWFVVHRLSASKEKIILLCGVSNSGKTVAFLRLMTGQFLPTVISASANEGPLQIGTSSVHLIDIPGAEELRKMIISEKLKKSVSGIIFMVDSSAYYKESKEVSELLFEVLCLLKSSKAKGAKVLVACNKQDLLSAKTSASLKSSLEKELSVLNKTQMFALGSTTITGVASSISKTYLSDNPSGAFSFDSLPMRVDFCDCSSKTSANELDKEETTLQFIKEWLNGEP